MKKWIVLAVLAFGGYQLYERGYWPNFSEGAFDAEGNPIVRVFVGPGCGQRCAKVTTLLDRRNVDYERVDVSTPKGQDYGVRRYPLTMVGDREVLGDNSPHIVSALAENFGDGMLTRTERAAMRNHFADNGRPVVLMYGTNWCPYCKKQRAYFEENGIEYYEIDAEKSAAGKLAYRVLRGGGYPLTYVGYRRFDGYKTDEILRAIRELDAQAGG